jgi:hypothetical protein
MEESKIINKNQIGFMETGRTADHLFSLKSSIDSYKQKKKKVYAAFIDLKKRLMILFDGQDYCIYS